MNLNLFLKEFKNNLKGSVITSVVVVLYTAFSLLIYSSMKENISKVTDFYYIMPESFRVAFNFNINQWDNVLGFYVTYFVYFVPLLLDAILLFWAQSYYPKKNRTKQLNFYYPDRYQEIKLFQASLLLFLFTF